MELLGWRFIPSIVLIDLRALTINNHLFAVLRVNTVIVLVFDTTAYLRISLFCIYRVAKVTAIRRTDRQATVMKPFWYRGAVVCCQTIKGSQAYRAQSQYTVWIVKWLELFLTCRTYAIWFIEPMTIARSSLSSEQISWAHLEKDSQYRLEKVVLLRQLTPSRVQKDRSLSP